MGPVRLIASDLDGTFLAPDETVSSRNAAAVASAHRAGVPFVVATGRPSRWVGFLHDLIGHDDPLAVVSNGAEIIRLATGESVHRWPIVPSLAAATCRAARSAVAGVVLGMEWGATFGLERATIEWPYDTRDRLVWGTLPELLARPEPILKIMVLHPELHTEALYEAVAPALPDGVTATFSYLATPGVVEIAAAGISKAHALQVVCTDLRIAPEEVAAFGDMPNDLPMLRWAGRSYLMPGAHPTLLATDLEVLTGPPEDAVGRKIEELLGITP